MLTTPLNSWASPRGTWKGMHWRPKDAWMSETFRAKLAFSRSILLTTNIRGIPAASHMFHDRSVPTSTPEGAATTRTAPSTTLRALTTSPKKSSYPGVSKKLILASASTIDSSVVWMLLPRFTSSGSKSDTVLPSEIVPMRVVALVVNRAASPKDVLPDPEWPRRATFLRSLASIFGIAPFHIGDGEWAIWP